MARAATPELEAARRVALSAAGKRTVRREGTVAGRYVWTHDQVKTLRDMWARKAPIKLIAHETGKSEKAVKSMRHYLKLPQRKATGENKTERLNLYVSPSGMEGLRRRAQYYQRSPQAYVEMLLKRDGAF